MTVRDVLIVGSWILGEVLLVIGLASLSPAWGAGGKRTLVAMMAGVLCIGWTIPFVDVSPPERMRNMTEFVFAASFIVGATCLVVGLLSVLFRSRGNRKLSASAIAAGLMCTGLPVFAFVCVASATGS